MYGETLKKIRIKKGLRQREVCEGIVTLSYYSRIERNISEPSIVVFLQLLKVLNVTFDEFMFIHRNYSKSDEEKLWLTLTELYHAGDIKGLKEQKRLLTTKLINNHESDSILLLISLFIYRLSGERTDDLNISSLINNLLSFDSWTMLEIKIFTTIMDQIPIKTVLLLVNRILKKRNLYYFSRGYDSPYNKILLNTILLCINENYLTEGSRYLTTYKNMLEVRDLYGKNMGLYLEGLLMYKSGKISEGEQLVNISFNIFKLLHSEELSDKYQTFFEYHRNNTTNPLKKENL